LIERRCNHFSGLGHAGGADKWQQHKHHT
jgi:hypothetical protein